MFMCCAVVSYILKGRDVVDGLLLEIIRRLACSFYLKLTLCFDMDPFLYLFIERLKDEVPRNHSPAWDMCLRMCREQW